MDTETGPKATPPQVPDTSSVYIFSLETWHVSLMLTTDVPVFVHESISVSPCHNFIVTVIVSPTLECAKAQNAVVPSNSSCGFWTFKRGSTALTVKPPKSTTQRNSGIIRFHITFTPFHLFLLIETNERGQNGTPKYRIFIFGYLTNLTPSAMCKMSSISRNAVMANQTPFVSSTQIKPCDSFFVSVEI